ncbi:protein kinase domain-containing protein ppk32 [Cordyceps fumosorosea ARSEF 2679]|uniref:Protein kinase domain-containing protein ppk32 n=1 Tax=Cordyceps fumosorosea (strain ARSEF 2679) TaxID=1081104 RepID=A0A167WJ47_CORFA|nr:protein kinase domain-containing protein ppk32 [Cordyceps fumosorosea ARSEF 2679]OAA63856.1 protein kinase domain-containing protein ppk32 [Cordyceps fumosorosea ARSEF 2679]
MFSNALKSISATNITGNYTISPNATSTAGPWRIYDAKKKSTGKPYSVFVFDKKSLDAHGNSLGRSGATSFKKTVEEVVERLKKEASSLAKLRHPNILELVEPVEETRGGGLQFVTEPVTASLASLLQEKDEQERSGGPGGRSSRYVTEDADGVRRRRELEIDELEIQKGLLQISKALEFFHENAGLVHGNLTPEAILINSKSDWKISGLSFCSPADGSNKPTSIQGISLHEVLNLDPRLPKYVQLNLDYTSPDFVMDNNLTSSADMFSLGLLAVALYNSPHRSPLESHGSISTYKRLFSSSSTVPSGSNSFLSSRPLPKELANHVLPRLITRRPAQRMTAREFQESEYFDNILVSTIRFLDSFPAKTPNEKSQFLRGLNKVLPSFPKSVMEKKILPALLDELKDKELLSLILQNVFKIVDLLPSARRAFSERVRPALKEIFVTNAKQTQEKDAARDAGLMVFLENLAAAANNCNGKEFKDDILPVVVAAIECPTPSIVDAALRSLPVVLPALDFSTIKNELFPIVAAVFSKTNSLAIKVRGLQSFVILCGGSNDGSSGDDGLSGLMQEKKKTSSSTALDKYTMQEKIVPLIKVIKTKEPAVMMASLNVLGIVGDIADADFVAMDILPILWSMSLGPLLNLKQFQAFMALIKTLSRRVEDEQTRKLQELAGTPNGATAAPNEDFLAFGGVTGTAFDSGSNGATADDFEALVKGKATGSSPNPGSNGFASWDAPQANPVATAAAKSPISPQAPAFSWSTQAPVSPAASGGRSSFSPQQQQASFRTVTPDLARFEPMAPSSTQYSQPLQPSTSSFAQPASATTQSTSSSINWGATAASTPNPWTSTSGVSTPNYSNMGAGTASMASSMASLSIGGGHQPQRPPLPSQTTSFSLPPPPGAGASKSSAFGDMQSSSASAWATSGSSMGGMMAQQQQQQRTMSGSGMGMVNTGGGTNASANAAGQSKSGLDKYQSLI